MGSSLETIYDLLTKPRGAFADIAATKTLPQAALIVFFSTLIATISVFAGEVGAAAKTLLVLAQLISTFLTWILSAALWHLLAELLGGQGSAKQLLKALGFVYFLQILVVPVYLVAFFLPQSGFLWITLAAIVVVIWSAALEIMAIRFVYGISGGRAALVFFIPPLAIALLVIVAVVAAGSAFMAAAEGIFANPPQF